MAGLAVAGTLGFASNAWAGAADYAFQPVPGEIKAGRDVTVEVRLVDAAGQPVAVAAITRTRLDMAPDGMAQHVVKAMPAPAAMPGVYRFTADLEMAGRWQLSLAARVAGEPETVTGKVMFVVGP
jgi:YtkA-like